MRDYHVIRTARLCDRQVLDLIYALKEEFELNFCEINLGFGAAKSVMELDRDDESIQKFDRDRYHIYKTSIVTKIGVNIDFLRGICSSTDQPHSDRISSQNYDEVVVSASSGITVEQLLGCMDKIEDSLPRIFPFHTDDREQDLQDFFQAQFTSLTSQYSKLLAALDKERADFRSMFEEERKKLNADHQYKVSRYEYESAQKQREFEEFQAEERGKLDRRKEGLDELKKSIDDSQYMDKRRQLRSQITENYKKRVEQPVVSKRAGWIQWLVFGLSLAVGLLAAYFSFEGYQNLLNMGDSVDPWKKTVGGVRSLTLTVVAVVFIFYAINWLKGIYLDHIRTERKYENYGNDIDRASFVIETIMEVGENSKAAVPDKWIAGVCRNLFSESGSDSYDASSSNLATMLLESISDASFRSKNAEIKIDRRGARKLAKKAKKN